MRARWAEHVKAWGKKINAQNTDVKEGNHLENLGVGVRIILKLILKK
jgi:hypothetical protein